MQHGNVYPLILIRFAEIELLLPPRSVPKAEIVCVYIEFCSTFQPIKSISRKAFKLKLYVIITPIKWSHNFLNRNAPFLPILIFRHYPTKCWASCKTSSCENVHNVPLTKQSYTPLSFTLLVAPPLLHRVNSTHISTFIVHGANVGWTESEKCTWNGTLSSRVCGF